MQIKTMRYHFITVRMAIINKTSDNKCGDVVKKKEPSFTVIGNVNWYSHCEKQYGGSSKN